MLVENIMLCPLTRLRLKKILISPNDFPLDFCIRMLVENIMLCPVTWLWLVILKKKLILYILDADYPRSSSMTTASSFGWTWSTETSCAKLLPKWLLHLCMTLHCSSKIQTAWYNWQTKKITLISIWHLIISVQKLEFWWREIRLYKNIIFLL